MTATHGTLVFEVLGWADAGISWSRIAHHVGLPVVDVGALITARAVTELAQYGAAHDTDLVRSAPGRCLLSVCSQPPLHRGLCHRHYKRVRAGIPLLGSRDGTVRTCVVCGVRWCGLSWFARGRSTCGDRRCIRELAAVRRPVDPIRQARDILILDRLKAGVPYKVIAAEVGLSKSRISHIVTREGIRRYATPRGPAQIAARERRRLASHDRGGR